MEKEKELWEMTPEEWEEKFRREYENWDAMKALFRAAGSFKSPGFPIDAVELCREERGKVFYGDSTL